MTPRLAVTPPRPTSSRLLRVCHLPIKGRFTTSASGRMGFVMLRRRSGAVRVYLDGDAKPRDLAPGTLVWPGWAA